jgi:LPXTG-motif cell wall-anchored protein
MKFRLALSFLLVTVLSYAQGDTTVNPEPYRETSFTNKDLLLLALAGLAVLMAGYFLFRRSKKRAGRS